MKLSLSLNVFFLIEKNSIFETYFDCCNILISLSVLPVYLHEESISSKKFLYSVGNIFRLLMCWTWYIHLTSLSGAIPLTSCLV